MSQSIRIGWLAGHHDFCIISSHIENSTEASQTTGTYLEEVVHQSGIFCCAR